jgi:hypothetical protein
MTCLDAQRVRSGLSWDTFHIARTRLVFKYCKNSVKTGGFKKKLEIELWFVNYQKLPKIEVPVSIRKFWFSMVF